MINGFQDMNIKQLAFPSLVDSHMECFTVGLIMNKAAMNIHIQVVIQMCFHFSWGKTNILELLGHMVSICLAYKELPNDILKGLQHFICPLAIIGHFQYIHILQCLVFSVFFYFILLMGIQQFLIMSITHISLRTNDTEHHDCFIPI